MFSGDYGNNENQRHFVSRLINWPRHAENGNNSDHGIGTSVVSRHCPSIEDNSTHWKHENAMRKKLPRSKCPNLQFWTGPLRYTAQATVLPKRLLTFRVKFTRGNDLVYMKQVISLSALFLKRKPGDTQQSDSVQSPMCHRPEGDVSCGRTIRSDKLSKYEHDP